MCRHFLLRINRTARPRSDRERSACCGVACVCVVAVCVRRKAVAPCAVPPANAHRPPAAAAGVRGSVARARRRHQAVGESAGTARGCASVCLPSLPCPVSACLQSVCARQAPRLAPCCVLSPCTLKRCGHATVRSKMRSAVAALAVLCACMHVQHGHAFSLRCVCMRVLAAICTPNPKAIQCLLGLRSTASFLLAVKTTLCPVYMVGIAWLGLME